MSTTVDPSPVTSEEPVMALIAPYLELDLTISDRAREWQRKARAFATDVVAPYAHRLDRLDANAAAAAGSPFFEFLALAHREGFTRLSGPAELGALGVSRAEECLILEELATADAALAAEVFLAPFVFQFAALFGDSDLHQNLCVPYYAGAQPRWHSCWAVTEMNHGSDYIGAHTPDLLQRTPGAVTARRDGGEWVITGSKSRWISGGLTASHALVFCNLEPDGLDRGGIIVIPLDTPGVERGAPLDKLGLRPVNQAQLTFHDVRVPASHLLVGPGDYAHVLYLIHSLSNAATALLAVGIGRAAYDGARAWCNQRAQGGKPIIGHQATRIRLFRMFSLLEAARALARAVYLYNHQLADTHQPTSLPHANAAKVFTTEACFEICDIAIQLCGARATDRNGIQFPGGATFYPEKLFRDAKTFKLVDGENTFLSLIAAAHLT